MNNRVSIEERFVPTVIIGTGFGGLSAAVNLRKKGIHDFEILERASEVGGTWRDNTYPGVACDVASDLYSLSFAPNPDWKQTHGKGSEIHDYIKSVVKNLDLFKQINFNTEVVSANWQKDKQLWKIETNKGVLVSKVLISAVGPFGTPTLPNIPGRDTFKGEFFHTFHWDHDQDLTGKRVAIIGTGATSVQVVPAIQPKVKKLTVFQRTPTHLLPRVDKPHSAFRKMLYKRLPFIQRFMRASWYVAYELISGAPQLLSSRFLTYFENLAAKHMRSQISDPQLIEKLTPKFRYGCKRPVMSNLYFPALAQNNVDLVTEGVSSIDESGVIDSSGTKHEVDVIIYATGFSVPQDFYSKIVGKDNKTIFDTWGKAPKSYYGTSVSGFPNFFIMLGPFSAAGNQSAIYMLETQAKYIAKAVTLMRKKGIASVDIREEHQTEFCEQMKQLSQKTTWVNGGCSSYYQNSEGGNSGIWPNWSFLYRWKTNKFKTDKFNIEKAEAEIVS